MALRSLMGSIKAHRLTQAFAAALAACLLLALVPWAGPAHAQDTDYDLIAVVDEIAGDTVAITVNVDPHSTPLGALEGSLVFDPSVVTPTSCDFIGDLGACNPLEDRLRFSALFLDGLADSRTLLTITFSARESATVTTIDFVDVAGFDSSTAPILAGTTPLSFTTGSGSSNPLLVALPLIAIAALGGIAFLSARNRRT